MNYFCIIEKTCYRRREETATVREFLLSNDYTETSQLGRADLVVFFACSGLRFLSVEKLKEIKETGEKMRPGAELIVGGCLPGMESDLLRGAFEGKTITPTNFGALNDLPGLKVRIETMPGMWGGDATCRQMVKPRFRVALRMFRDDALRQCLKAVIRYWPHRRLKKVALRIQRRNTATFSIAAGCARRCSYCAKPLASGKVRSKPLNAVVRSISEGIRMGYRAFDLYADSIGNYGLDQNTSFGDLLNGIGDIHKRFSIGLFDVHPHDFIRYFDSIERLCRAGKLHYIYVPVQSGNERVLQLMKRPCNIEDLAAKLTVIRRYDHVFMQSGIIAGFPGETDEEFEDTLKFLRRIRFDDVYVHYYCDMPNTESSTLSHKVDKEGMLKRLERIRWAGIDYNAAATRHEWESNLGLPVSGDGTPGNSPETKSKNAPGESIFTTSGGERL